MNYFLMAYNKYAQFSGRSTRSEYWYFILFYMLFLGLGSLVDSFSDFPVAISLFCLVSFIPNLAVTVRRLHDTNRSGWWYFISLIPLIGFIMLVVFLAQESDPNDNQYGPNPFNEGNLYSRHLVDS